MTGHFGTLVLALAGILIAAPAFAEQQPVPSYVPRCTDPSHARLVVQPGRDVCAPTLLPTGPVSVGFMPTACAEALPQLTIDAIKERDVCVAKVRVTTSGKP